MDTKKNPVELMQGKEFSSVKIAAIVLAIIAPMVVCMTQPPTGLSVVGWRVLGIICSMVVLWITEAVPIGITSLLPIVLCPMLGLAGRAPGKATGINCWEGMASPASVMVIGMFFLSAAMVKWNLHKRIALTIIAMLNGKPRNILLGFILATGIISAFMSNTTCVAMMLPLAIALLSQMGEKPGSKFGMALILSLPYASSIGGIATSIGSGTNIAAMSMINKMNGIEISFLDWLMIGGPFSVIMIPLLWLLMCFLFKVTNENSTDSDIIRKELAALGPMQGGERLMFIFFFVATACLVFRKFIIAPIFPMLGDENLFIVIGFLLFIVPVDLKHGIFLMDLKTARGISWDTFLLIAGGMTMGSMFQKAGIAKWLAGHMDFMAGWSSLSMMIALMLIVAFLSELCSNIVIALAFLPVVHAMAINLGYNPLFLQFAVALSASFAFMLPSGTPPNALAYGSGYFEVKDLARTGFWVQLACCFVMPFVLYFISANISPLFKM